MNLCGKVVIVEVAAGRVLLRFFFLFFLADLPRHIAQRLGRRSAHRQQERCSSGHPCHAFHSVTFLWLAIARGLRYFSTALAATARAPVRKLPIVRSSCAASFAISLANWRARSESRLRANCCAKPAIVVREFRSPNAISAETSLRIC